MTCLHMPKAWHHVASRIGDCHNVATANRDSCIECLNEKAQQSRSKGSEKALKDRATDALDLVLMWQTPKLSYQVESVLLVFTSAISTRQEQQPLI